MELIEQLLRDVVREDKKDNPGTTSFQFKRDLWNFFQGFEDKVCVEFGTHKGQTTHILSHLFKKVYTVNQNDNASSKELNKDVKNIVHIDNFDLYSQNPLPIKEPIDVFLIDAGHEYQHIVMDINRASNMLRNRESFIIFDDYGLARWENSVHIVVNKAKEMGFFEVVKEIGHKKGHVFGEGNRFLKHSEGIIGKFLV